MAPFQGEGAQMNSSDVSPSFNANKANNELLSVALHFLCVWLGISYLVLFVFLECHLANNAQGFHFPIGVISQREAHCMLLWHLKQLKPP
jgi:hypothetical protein